MRGPSRPVLGKWYRGKLERLDSREGEKVRRAHFVWRCAGRLREADIHDELLEDALRQLGAYAEANRLKLIDLIECIGSGCHEGEEVIETESLRRSDVFDRSLLVVVPPEVDVLGRPRSSAQPEVERQAPPSAPSDPATPARGVAGTVRRRLACEVARGRTRSSRPPSSSAAPAPCEMRQRSRISRGHRRKSAAYRVVATTPSCLLFEFPRREQPAAERLPQGHLQLLGLQFPGYVDERSRRGG